MKPNSRPRRSGFTLIEVIAGLAIVFFLMGALMQAIADQEKYNEVATRRMSESQIARTLLHQIADELRTVMPPLVKGKDPGRARFLLGMGDHEKERRESLGGANPPERSPSAEEMMAPPEEMPFEQPLPELPRGAGRDDMPPDGAERFGLLGTSNRLIMMVRRGSDQKSPLDLYREEESGRSTDGAIGGEEQEKRRGPERWGDQQQVYYLLRPLPDALEKQKKIAEGEMMEELEVPTVGDEERFEPYYSGVLRQQIRVPFSHWAQDEAKFHLEGQVLPKNDQADEFRLPELELPTIDEGKDEIPLPPQISTDLVTDRITALKFRYHNGRSWQDAWDKPDELPVAVEISLSFDPRAADPEYLTKYFEERRSTSATSGISGGLPSQEGLASTEELPIEESATSSPMGSEEEEPPLFPYRLVVALPGAKHVLPIVASNENQSERPPGEFGEPPIPPGGGPPPGPLPGNGPPMGPPGPRGGFPPGSPPGGRP
ncbi:prepilin-type N-terminal cleavage/methylation domain-containing protein [bacterium]|nr:prepilin-type N-terminal cleavage/methylation domain-containing protein [bacterium]